MIAFWLELIIIAIFAIFKIVMVHPKASIFFVPLFALVSYGMLTGIGFVIGGIIDSALKARQEQVNLPELGADLMIPLLWFIVSHGFSFWHNFLKKKEYLARNIEKQFSNGLFRMGITWAGALPAAFIALLINPEALIVLIIVTKTAFDLAAHLNSHKMTTDNEDDSSEIYDYRPSSPPQELKGLGVYLVFLVATSLIAAPLRDIGYSYGERLTEKQAARRHDFQQQHLPKCDGSHVARCIELCDEEEDPAACNRLAWFYKKGQNTEKNPTQARRLFKKACDLNLPSACGHLGYAYYLGDLGLDKDYHKSIQLFRIGCNGNDTSSCYFLALHYDLGLGIEKNPQTAALHYERACQEEHEASCYHLKKLRAN